ncbi:hypothetical protein XA3_15000 [Xylocopilactobacillus apicola]|uniref:SCP domain-containing protein n=2 Tax=Xylocopilactobacillus apicola TaxID=2932184 RepID=A0AAU9DSL9_9LACO|nr:hypothetical protein XA3_15000 [Xylocopilactobacillus apicola]
MLNAAGSLTPVHAENISLKAGSALNQFNQEIWAQKILTEMNRLRSQNNLQPVTSDPILMPFTQARAETQRANGSLSHEGRYENSNYSWTSENLAMTPFTGGPNTDAKNVVAQLYDDKGVPTFGHRKNMLAPFINKVGIGVAYDAANGCFWTAMTLIDDRPSTDPDLLNRYYLYCNQNGVDDTSWPTHYDMTNKEYLTAHYNEQGISQDQIADSKFGPNTKTPANPNGTESGAPESGNVSEWTIEDVSKIGFINYVPGYGIAIYDEPGGSSTGQYLAHGTGWKIFQRATNTKNEIYYNVGKNQWIRSEYVSFTPIDSMEPMDGVVTINYIPGFGVNLWKDASTFGGFYEQKLPTGTQWKVMGKKNGFYNVGKNQWIQSDYAILN